MEDYRVPKPSRVLSAIYGCHAFIFGIFLLSSAVTLVMDIVDGSLFISWFSSIMGVTRDFDIPWALFYIGVLMTYCIMVFFVCLVSCTIITWVWRHVTEEGRYTNEYFVNLPYPKFRDLRGTKYLRACLIYIAVFFTLTVWNCSTGTTKLLGFFFKDDKLGTFLGIFSMPLVFVGSIGLCSIIGVFCLTLVPCLVFSMKMWRYLFPWYASLKDYRRVRQDEHDTWS